MLIKISLKPHDDVYKFSIPFFFKLFACAMNSIKSTEIGEQKMLEKSTVENNKEK